MDERSQDLYRLVPERHRESFSIGSIFPSCSAPRLVCGAFMGYVVFTRFVHITKILFALASGVANGAGSRDQESIGEAVNGYYGSMLWAQVTGNTDAYNFARLLLATEQHGAQVYWHLYPSQSSNDRDQPYPEDAVRALITMGNVEDSQSGAWL